MCARLRFEVAIADVPTQKPQAPAILILIPRDCGIVIVAGEFLFWGEHKRAQKREYEAGGEKKLQPHFSL